MSLRFRSNLGCGAPSISIRDKLGYESMESAIRERSSIAIDEIRVHKGQSEQNTPGLIFGKSPYVIFDRLFREEAAVGARYFRRRASGHQGNFVETPLGAAQRLEQLSQAG